MRRLLDSLLFSGETKSLLEFCWACNLAHVSALQWYLKPVSPVLCSCFVEKIPWCLWLHVWLNAFNLQLWWWWCHVHDFLKIYVETTFSTPPYSIIWSTWFSENLCRDDVLYTSILYFIIWRLLEASTFTKKKL
jgi:hypothetical protein